MEGKERKEMAEIIAILKYLNKKDTEVTTPSQTHLFFSFTEV